MFASRTRTSIAIAAVALAIGCSSSERNPAAAASLEGELATNDVSILWPLPSAAELDQLMSATSAGAHGELLPRSVFDLAPPLLPSTSPDALYASLRVVAARVDPCFPSLAVAPSPECRFQLRLVMQPLDPAADELSASDAALHLFYDLPAGDFVALLADLLQLRADAPASYSQAPLGVQPLIAEQGLSGPHARELERVLLAKIGERRLTRMTFMQLGADGRTWTFGGFDFAEGGPVPIGILESKVTEQTFTNDTTDDALAFAGAVTPALAGSPEQLGPLYDSKLAASLDEETLWSLYESILRIENPEQHSPESVDCVSCHTAQPARLWLDRNTLLGERESPLRYQSSIDLTLQPIEDTTSVLRAFGYFGSRPAISARVAHESAAVATHLNDHVLERP